MKMKMWYCMRLKLRTGLELGLGMRTKANPGPIPMCNVNVRKTEWVRVSAWDTDEGTQPQPCAVFATRPPLDYIPPLKSAKLRLLGFSQSQP